MRMEKRENGTKKYGDKGGEAVKGGERARDCDGEGKRK